MALTHRRLGRTLGAEISGFDLNRDLDDQVLAEILDLWNDSLVLCFRDQNLTPEDFIRLARVFGEIMPQVVKQKEFSLEGHPEIGVLRSDQRDTGGDGRLLKRGEGWHTDHSHVEHPPKATMVYAVRLPSRGGNTNFANTRAAYEGLSEDVKARIQGWKALHAYQSRRSPRAMPTRNAEEEAISKGTLHPVVRTHVDTGRQALYLNPIRVDAIDGVDDEEAFATLDALLEHAVSDEYRYSHEWSLHDVIIWDNRCALHAATFDYDPSEQRTLHRMMIKGERPV